MANPWQKVAKLFSRLSLKKAIGAFSNAGFDEAALNATLIERWPTNFRHAHRALATKHRAYFGDNNARSA